jgi:transcriptional regulator of acetoin/glycerol metabolism
VVTSAVLSSRDYEIGLADLPPLQPARSPRPPDPAASLEGLEREAVVSALHKTGGHHQKAADLLGISRRTLTRKLKLYRAGQPEDAIHVF